MLRTAKQSDLTRATIAALICGCLATLGCLLQGDETSRLVMLVLFLVCVIPVARYFGRTTAIIGSAVASLTFAVLLFPPLYSLRIENYADRVSLIIFQAVAITLACLTHVHINSSRNDQQQLPDDATLHGWQRMVDKRRRELREDRNHTHNASP